MQTLAPASWRARGRLLRIGPHTLFTLKEGAGAPLLLLHGYPTSSYDFARVVPRLARTHRVVAFDFLGFGWSDKPRRHPYSLLEQAELAEAVARAHGVARCALLAHDIGASVALELLRRGRLEVTGMVLLNASLRMAAARPLLIQRLLLHPLIGPALSRLGLPGRGGFGRRFGGLFASPPPAHELDAFWELICWNGGRSLQHRLIRYLHDRALHEEEWLQALAVHRAPLTLVWGQRDPVARPAVADAVLARRRDARYVPLPDAGHYPHWEDPEAVAAAVREGCPGLPA